MACYFLFCPLVSTVHLKRLSGEERALSHLVTLAVNVTVGLVVLFLRPLRDTCRSLYSRQAQTHMD